MSILSTKRPSRTDEARDRALRQVRDDASPTSRLNVQVPKDLLRDIKVIAARSDQTVSDIVREFLIEYRSKYSDE